MNPLLHFYVAQNVIDTQGRLRVKSEMIRCVLILCAFSEFYLQWFLVALTRETRRSASHTERRSPRHASVSRSEDGADGAERFAILK
jgi:hypothetical protein